MTQPATPPAPQPIPAPLTPRKIPRLWLFAVIGGGVLACALFACVAVLANPSKPKNDQAAPPPSTPAVQASITQAPPPPPRPGSPEAYASIETETDCARLQDSFDTAETNHDAALNRGNVDLAKISTAYMDAIGERMRELSC